MLSKNLFTLLNALRQNGPAPTQAELAKQIGLSVGTVNAALRELRDHKWIEPKALAITASGLRQLEPFRVNNAIILAAGFSSRFAPITYERPKGLLSVQGEVLIERQIRQLREAGIQDITIVVGYLKELFFYLADKYDVRIVMNDEYATRNNHSSLYRVRNQLSRTYICSSDNYFSENVFEPYVYEAYYAGVYSEGPTDEWCMATSARDVITSVAIGGEDSWYMLGHAFFDDAFSQTMRQILEEEYDLPATKAKLWEHLFVDHIDELRMVLRRYPKGVIWEFDSIEDMLCFDATFLENVDSRILDNIASVLHCDRADIKQTTPLKSGRTNLSCKFRVHDDWYVYRHPGASTDKLINRASEAFSEEAAKELGLDTTFIYEDPIEGWKISRYVEITEAFDYKNEVHVCKAIELARTLHRSGIESPFIADVKEDAARLLAALAESNRTSYPEFQVLQNMFGKLQQATANETPIPCLCHNDLYAPNFLISNDEFDLIDWEYSGMSDYAADLGTFICCCDFFSYDDVLNVLKLYFQREPTPEELRHCVAYISLVAFRWYLWSVYQEMFGIHVGELLYTYYRYAKEYGKRALELYGME